MSVGLATRGRGSDALRAAPAGVTITDIINSTVNQGHSRPPEELYPTRTDVRKLLFKNLPSNACLENLYRPPFAKVWLSTCSLPQAVTFAIVMYCVFCNVVITYYLYIFICFLPPSMNYKIISLFLVYLVAVVVSLLSDSEGFGDHVSSLSACDALLGVRPRMDVPVSRLLYIVNTLITIGAHIPTIVTNVSYVPELVLSINFVLFVHIASTNNFARIIMFELLWYRMRLFRKSFKKTLSDISIKYYDDEAVATLRNSMLLYKKISDIATKAHVPMKFMVSDVTRARALPHSAPCITVTIFHAFGKILITLYEIKFNVMTEVEVSSFKVYSCIYRASVARVNGEQFIPVRIQELFAEILLPLMPVVFAELVVWEQAAIRLDIGRQIMAAKDARLRAGLEDCLCLLQHAACRVSVLRLFRVDASLLVGFLNYCITYALALAQFAHFSD
ncbi:unnamed protein product [Chrysodeixis includens]|uniref:Gustatory receptor n=1 Tax=Chrysodeixis includens TaxID=689277 RepID=A0A9N8PY88_CHRIL|nr:unnamed protein product [Chrysodeixis includens]